MKWTPDCRSSNIEDRRGRSMGPLGLGGGILTLILALIFGPEVLQQGGGESVGGEVALSPEDSAREEPMVQFMSFVLDDAQQTWKGAFEGAGSAYRPATLVLFRNGTQSACGI